MISDNSSASVAAVPPTKGAPAVAWRQLPRPPVHTGVVAPARPYP